jgi:hypothetical protein
LYVDYYTVAMMSAARCRGTLEQCAVLSGWRLSSDSALELAFQVRLAGRLGFGDNAELEQLQELTKRLLRMIRRLHAAVRRR